MSEASFASLGPTLLARKGGAKPAMRPQLAPLPEAVADHQLEDLGWNDMGNDDDGTFGENRDAENTADIVSIHANAQPESPPAPASESPLVVRQQRSLADRLLADAAMASPESTSDQESENALIKQKPTTSVRSKAVRSARRSAFTLRLDTDRHLKLRLAATIQGVSAQALVTEALDAMLSEIEDLDALAQRFNSRMKTN